MKHCVLSFAATLLFCAPAHLFAKEKKIVLLEVSVVEVNPGQLERIFTKLGLKIQPEAEQKAKCKVKIPVGHCLMVRLKNTNTTDGGVTTMPSTYIFIRAKIVAAAPLP